MIENENVYGVSWNILMNSVVCFAANLIDKQKCAHPCDVFQE